jgi:hypothetical protein
LNCHECLFWWQWHPIPTYMWWLYDESDTLTKLEEQRRLITRLLEPRNPGLLPQISPKDTEEYDKGWRKSLGVAINFFVPDALLLLSKAIMKVGCNANHGIGKKVYSSGMISFFTAISLLLLWLPTLTNLWVDCGLLPYWW